MLSQFFINRPKFAFVISIVIVVVGLICIESMPVSQYPDIVPPIVQVSTNYPGADAIMMEKTVVAPLEQQINGVENMLYMVTQCSDQGVMITNISFEVGSRPDIDTVNTLIRTNIALPQLPPEVTSEGITVIQKSTDILLLLTLHSPNGEYNDIFLSNYAYLNLYDEISRLPGVGDVQIIGNLNYAIRVWVDPVKMASLRVTPKEVLNAINEQNVQIPAGQLGGPPSTPAQQFEYTLLLQSRMENVEEFKNIIVRANTDGSLIKLSDLADVSLGSQSYSSYGVFDGKPASNIAVFILPGANSIKVAQEVKQLLDRARKSFPKGLEGDIFYDTMKFVTVSMKEVLKTLYIAIVLVILVVFIFLQNWRAALIPTIAIPVSLIGTFIIMLAMGYSINTISLFGLILAIGIVVDDAIVVVENVHRIMEEDGLTPVEATRRSMDQVTGPIVATTLVLMAVFVPIAFIPGISGQIYRQFAVTIAASVGISAINALTLSPALCATLLKPMQHGKKKWFFFRFFNRFFDALTSGYMKLVSSLIRKIALAVIIFGIIIISIIGIYVKTPTGFLPNEDQGLLNVDIQLPSSASLVRTKAVLDKIYDILKKEKGISNVIYVPGYSALSPANTSNLGHMFVILDDWSKRKTPELQEEAIRARLSKKLTKEVPEAYVLVFDRPPIPGLGATGGFQFELEQRLGNNPQKLSEVLGDFINEAKKQPELEGIYSNYISNIPKLNIKTDIAKVKKLGIPLQDVFTAVNAYIGSIYINQFNVFGKVFQVLIQAKPEDRSRIEDIYSIYVQNNKNTLIPLRTLVNITSTLAPNAVNHYNMRANAEIQGSNAPGYSSGQAISAMERVAAKILPEGFTYEWTGTAYQEILAGSKAIIIFLLALGFIYLFLVAKYESWMLSLAVMLSVPVAIIGALVGISIAGIENNIYVQVGFVLIFGMATKTAILIVEFAHEQRKSGKGILESAQYASHLRFRAVIMTAFAFILGVFPLVISDGAGAVSRRSLGTAVFGGMIAAAVIGTIMIPCFYVILQKIVTGTSSRKPKE